LKYTIEEARTILGIDENSSKDDIEKKYDIIIRKYRIAKSDGTLDEEAQAEYERNTEAYRILMGYEIEEPQVEEKDTIADKAFEKMGIDKKKANNFFYYHKFHIIVSIIALVIIGVSVYSFITKAKPDISIGIMGEVNQDSFEALKEKVVKNIPEIKELGIDSVTLSNNYKDQYASANMQKAIVLLNASDIDVYLLSKYVYDSYADSGPFMALDDFAKELNIDVSGSEYLKLRVVDEWENPKSGTVERKVLKYRDSEPKLYGIDVTNNNFFKGIDFMGPEKILVIRSDPKNLDLVKKLVKLFSE
jgi:hypothetical protein